MQSLLLAEDLLASVKKGIKFGTVRFGKREIDLSDLSLIGVESGSSLTVEVKSVTYCRLRHLTDDMLHAMGHGSVSEFLKTLKRFYPDITPEDIVTAVQW